MLGDSILRITTVSGVNCVIGSVAFLLAEVGLNHLIVKFYRAY